MKMGALSNKLNNKRSCGQKPPHQQAPEVKFHTSNDAYIKGMQVD